MVSEMAQIDYFKDVMIICVTIFDHFTRGEISARRNQNRRLGKWNQGNLMPSLLQTYSRDIQPFFFKQSQYIFRISDILYYMVHVIWVYAL